MHAPLILLGFWAFAFVTLCLALVLLHLYSDLIGYDFMLHSLGKEAFLVEICSLIEAASVWVVITYLPGATRALIVPAMLIFVICMRAHLEDWNRFDPGLVRMFQFIIGAIVVSLFGGHFGAALIIAVVFAGALAVIGSIAKGP